MEAGKVSASLTPRSAEKARNAGAGASNRRLIIGGVVRGPAPSEENSPAEASGASAAPRTVAPGGLVASPRMKEPNAEPEPPCTPRGGRVEPRPAGSVPALAGGSSGVPPLRLQSLIAPTSETPRRSARGTPARTPRCSLGGGGETQPAIGECERIAEAQEKEDTSNEEASTPLKTPRERAWQTEILTSLTSDKATALISHLRRSEQERLEAAELAAQLTERNGKLARQVAEAERERLSQGAAAGAAGVIGGGRWGWLPMSLFVCLCILAAVALLFAGQPLGGEKNSTPSVSTPLAYSASREIEAVAVESVGEAEEDTAAREDRLLAEVELDGVRRDLSVCEVRLRGEAAPLEEGAVLAVDGIAGHGDSAGVGTVRETRVREMTLRQQTSQSYGTPSAGGAQREEANGGASSSLVTSVGEQDRAEIEQMRLEHETMKNQLDRLMWDMDSAVQNGQDTICWKV